MTGWELGQGHGLPAAGVQAYTPQRETEPRPLPLFLAELVGPRAGTVAGSGIDPPGGKCQRLRADPALPAAAQARLAHRAAAGR